MRKLARHLNLAPSTVSAAVNGHPGVAAGTRERVRKAAEELGYRPNPELSAIMSRGASGPTASGTPVALIVDVPHGNPTYYQHEDYYLKPLRAGARELGFRVDHFNLADYRSPAELDRILYARGYRALLAGLWYSDYPRMLDMKLERYVVVGLGDLACDLPMLSIRVNIVQSIRLIWQKLKALDAERILFALRLEPEVVRKDYEMVGALKALQVMERPPWKIRIHIGRQNNREAERFCRIVQEWQPDVCVGYNRFHYDELVGMGYLIPRDLRYVQLHAASHHTYQPDGIRAPHVATAERAITEVGRLLRSGTFGTDPAMGEILLEPEWVEGRTLS